MGLLSIQFQWHREHDSPQCLVKVLLNPEKRKWKIAQFRVEWKNVCGLRCVCAWVIYVFWHRINCSFSSKAINSQRPLFSRCLYLFNLKALKSQMNIQQHKLQRPRGTRSLNAFSIFSSLAVFTFDFKIHEIHCLISFHLRVPSISIMQFH
jgi:hypothetical protein